MRRSVLLAIHAKRVEWDREQIFQIGLELRTLLYLRRREAFYEAAVQEFILVYHAQVCECIIITLWRRRRII